MGLLEKKDGTYFLRTFRGSVLPMIAGLLSVDGSPYGISLTRCVPSQAASLKGAGADETIGFTRNPEELQAFIGDYATLSERRWQNKSSQAVDPSAAKSFLDVGGGSGTYAIAFLHASPEMKANHIRSAGSDRNGANAPCSGRVCWTE